MSRGFVKEGDHVSVGDPLYVMDSSEAEKHILYPTEIQILEKHYRYLIKYQSLFAILM